MSNKTLSLLKMVANIVAIISLVVLTAVLVVLISVSSKRRQCADGGRVANKSKLLGSEIIVRAVKEAGVKFKHPILLVTSVTNDYYLEPQVNLLRKFTTDPFDLIVLNDAYEQPHFTNLEIAGEATRVAQTCKRLNVQCVRVPPSLHGKGRTALFPKTVEPKTNNACTRCADVSQFAAFVALARPNPPDLFALIDGDMMPFRPWSPRHLLKDKNIIGGVPQARRNNVWYLWNALLIFRPKVLLSTGLAEQLNCDCGRVNGVPVDVCGNLHYMLKDKRLKNRIASFPNGSAKSFKHMKPFLKKILSNMGGNIEVCSSTMLHFRNGGNWEQHSKQYLKKRLRQISKMVVTLCSSETGYERT